MVNQGRTILGVPGQSSLKEEEEEAMEAASQLAQTTLENFLRDVE